MFLKVILLCTVAVLTSATTTSPSWPKPPKKYPSRPYDGEPFCQSGDGPFCPDGLDANYMPTVADTDELYVYAMKTPVTKYLEKHVKLLHDAIGFHHVQSGLNLTMEWSELFQLFNCTFPQEPKHQAIKWCNQGATCVTPGIQQDRWTKEDGVLVQVATISGAVFNKFAIWTEQDNNTYPIYETWTVREKSDGRGTLWFPATDGSAWVLRAFDAMSSFGAQFNSSVQLNYTRLELISSEPQFLAYSNQVVKPSILYFKLHSFYSHFQKYKYPAQIEALIEYLVRFLAANRQFYLYVNDSYFLLPLKFPFLHVRYDSIPLPR